MKINGWTLFAHPLFETEVDKIEAAVLAARNDRPDGYLQHPAAVLLRALNHLVFEDIPADPGHRKFRQGKTLGPLNKDWFRGKIGERFRVFFRYTTNGKVIVLAWLNDQSTLRKRGASNDVYEVFRDMLASGNPPRTMGELLESARPLQPREELAAAAGAVPPPIETPPLAAKGRRNKAKSKRRRG